NKMDLVGFDQGRFDAVGAEMLELARDIGLPTPQVVPISALDGDNVVDGSTRTPWYDGRPLIEVLETVDLVPARDIDAAHLRLPIQWVARPRDGARRVYTGQLAAGTLSAGDEVVVVPSGARTTVTSLTTLDPHREG